MTLLKCATHIVSDLDLAVERFGAWLDYMAVETAPVSQALAQIWDAPASAGRRYSLLQPASGAAVFLRLVEGEAVEAYRPFRSYGWGAIELCVQDVTAMNERMLRSPFEVIGPPAPLDGFPTVKPMQVRGPDREIVYLTEILVDDPALGLPVARSLVDRPFIQVLGCRDLRASARWFADVLGLDVSEPVAIRYELIAQAFGSPPDELHELAICKWAGETFLELDQYPPEATARPAHPGALPPGTAVCTLVHPEFDRLDGYWTSDPVRREGALYQGRRVGVLRTPDGALLEIVDDLT